MSDPKQPRTGRRTTLVIVAVLIVVIGVVAAIAVATAQTPAPVSTTTPPSRSASVAPTQSAPSPSSSAKPTSTSKPTKSAAPKPQPTKTAAISSPAPIAKSLTASVTKLEAVQGTASGPGEIAGPSVRFTVRISNATGKSVSLANTVVNVYAGKDQSPAVELSGPGAKDLPASVASGSTATGVFVFNIPKSDRSQIVVTVDTSTANPVLAFKGSAP